MSLATETLKLTATANPIDESECLKDEYVSSYGACDNPECADPDCIDYVTQSLLFDPEVFVDAVEYDEDGDPIIGQEDEKAVIMFFCKQRNIHRPDVIGTLFIRWKVRHIIPQWLFYDLEEFLEVNIMHAVA